MPVTIAQEELKQNFETPADELRENNCLEFAQNRKQTDVIFFIIFITCVSTTIAFSLVFAVSGGLTRFIHGNDRFGNLCGVNNTPIAGVNTSGQDLTTRKIALMEYYPSSMCFRHRKRTIVPDRCVKSCPPWKKLIFHRCFPNDFVRLDAKSQHFERLLVILHVIELHMSTIIVMAVVALFLALSTFICLRYSYVGIIIWALVLFQIILTVTAGCVFWHKYLTSPYMSIVFLLGAIATTIYVIFIFLYVVVFSDSFGRLFQMFEESIKIISRMPFLLLHSALLFVITIAVVLLLSFVWIALFSNGYLEQAKDPLTFHYFRNSAALILAISLVLSILWIYSFAEGLQTMILAGSVGRYHLSKDKLLVHKFLTTSYRTTLKYHLGTVACGSLFSLFFFFVPFLTVKAYVEAAIHGQSFCKSVSKTLNMMKTNILEATSVIGLNWILTCGLHLFVILMTMCIALWMNWETKFCPYTRKAIIFGAFAAGIVASFIIRVITIVVYTVFVCDCEKNLISDDKTVEIFYLKPKIFDLVRKAKSLKKGYPQILHL